MGSGAAMSPQEKLQPGDPGFVGPVTADQKRDGYLRAIDAKVRAAGGVEDIKFDKDGVNEVISKLDALLVRKLEPSLRNAEDLYSVVPPGKEWASAGFAERANAAGHSYEKYLTDKIKGLRDYIALLERIRDKYIQDEEDTAGKFNSQDT